MHPKIYFTRVMRFTLKLPVYLKPYQSVQYHTPQMSLCYFIILIK